MATKKQGATETKNTETASPATATNTVAVPPKKKSNKTLWIVIGIVVVVLFVIPGILLAVGGTILKNKLDDPSTTEQLAEGLIEQATGSKVDVDAKDGNYTVKSEDGKSSIGVGDNQKLPEDFPKAVAQYLPEKKVVFVLTSDEEGKSSWSVSTTVDGTYNDTVKHFEGTILTPEYTDTSTYSAGETTTFYGKKDGINVNVTVTKDATSGETNVSYIIIED